MHVCICIYIFKYMYIHISRGVDNNTYINICINICGGDVCHLSFCVSLFM